MPHYPIYIPSDSFTALWEGAKHFLFYNFDTLCTIEDTLTISEVMVGSGKNTDRYMDAQILYIETHIDGYYSKIQVFELGITKKAFTSTIPQ